MSGFHYPGVPVTALLYSLWPLFALIVGGYALRRWDFPGEAFWPAAERLNYLLALMVPTVNVMSVWALTAERGISLRALLLPILKNPLILACLAGALVNLAGVGLPGGSDRLLNLLAVASLPLGLLCVGAALKPQELGGEVAALGWNCAARLLAMPLLAFAIARGLGLPSMESAVLVLFFALPTAPTAYVLTRQLGGDGHLMAGIITLQTLLSGATLVGVLLVLQGSP